MIAWFVIGRDGHVAENHVDAWGPFDNEADARAYAVDVSMDNGWEEVRAVLCDEEEVIKKTTQGKITSPYK